MDRPDRLSLYERFYFSELDRREKINARLALPFAVILATVGLLSWLINAPIQPSGSIWAYAFWTALVLSTILLFFGAWFFRKAWFGHTDKLIPTAGDLESYRRELLQFYADYEDCEDLAKSYFNGFVFNYFIECSSENAINNDRRSYNLYLATRSLTLSVLLAFSAAVPFYRVTLGSGV